MVVLLKHLDNSGFPWKQCSCVFSHVCINGARYGAITVTDADIWRPEFPILISGHIHEEQNIGNNVIYTGSSYQILDGETPEQTTFTS